MAALAIVLLFLAWEMFTGGQGAESPSSLLSPFAGIFGGSDVTQSTLQAMANAITSIEGGPGDRNYRNNNPGDLKPPGGGPNYWAGQVGVDGDGFAVFDTWQDGYNALLTNLSVHVAGNPSQTLTEYFASYSPDSTGLSGEYGAEVAAALGVSPDTELGQLA